MIQISYKDETIQELQFQIENRMNEANEGAELKVKCGNTYCTQMVLQEKSFVIRESKFSNCVNCLGGTYFV